MELRHLVQPHRVRLAAAGRGHAAARVAGERLHFLDRADADGTFLVADPFGGSCGACGAIFRVDPLTGMRTVVTDAGNAAQGTTNFNLTAVAVGLGGTICVAGCVGPTGYGAICRVDRTTGVRTVVTDLGNAAQRPLGVNFYWITIYH